MEEGIVIRGHDVARVVGLMAGIDVDWDEREAMTRLDETGSRIAARFSRSRCR